MYSRIPLFFVLKISFLISIAQSVPPPPGGDPPSVNIYGPSNVELNTSHAYSVTVSNGNHTSSSYTAYGGNVLSSSKNSVTVKWTSTGSRSVDVTAYINGNYYTDTHYVTVVSYTPVATQETQKNTTYFQANWNQVSGATGYYLDVAYNSSFTSYVSGYQSKLLQGNDPTGSTGVRTLNNHFVNGLTPGRNYYYRVRSKKPNGGASLYSNTITANTTLSYPVIGNPTNKKTDRFTTNWNEVTGATSYKLFVSASSNFSSHESGYSGKTISSGTSHTVTGLSPGKKYYYRIKAVSPAYETNYSASKESNTTLSTPIIGSPTNKKTDRFTANWSSVTGATSYKLYVSASSDFSNHLSGYGGKTISSGTSHAVTGLSPGKKYYYRVKAVSPVYTTGYSASKQSNTTLSTPVIGSPTNKKTDRFTANWSGVTGATSYKLYVSASSNFSNHVSGYGGKTISSGTSHTVTGLSPGKKYYYRVKAVSPVYTTGYSASKQSNTTLSTPVIGGPTNKKTDRFTANWSGVTGATSYKLYVSAISDFSSYVSDYDGKTISSGTSHTVTGLSPGKKYYYRVKAVSSAYTTGYSASKQSNTTLTTPIIGNPTNKKTDRFTANWSGVTGATSYKLYVSASSNFSNHVSGYGGKTISSGISHTVTGLSPGKKYYYRVKAVSSAYTTGYSASKQSNTTLSTPVIGGPTNKKTDRFTANWIGVTGATSYKLYVSASSDFSSHESDYDGKTILSGTSHTVTGLSPGKKYYYRVKAASSAYTTGYSASKVSNTTLSTPVIGGPTNKKTDRFTANWNGVTGATSYKLYVSASSNFSNHVSGYGGKTISSGTSHTVTGLSPGKKYYYRVKAVSSVYSTDFSDFKESNTTLSAPEALKESVKRTTNFKANWNAVDGANNYRLQVSTSASFSSLFKDEIVSDISLRIFGITYGTTYYYRVRAISNDNIKSAYSAIITVLPRVLSGTISYDGDVCSGSSPGMIYGTEATGGDGTYEYRWQYYDGTQWKTLATNAQTNYDPTITISSATKFRRRARSGGSYWRSSPELTIQITDPISNVGTLTTSETEDVCPGETVSLYFTKGDSRLDMNTARLVVVRDGQEVNLGALSSSGSNYEASTITHYGDLFKLKGEQLCTGLPIYSNAVTFSYSCNQPPSPGENFVRTEVPMVPVQTDEELSILNATKMSTTYSYFDGLGRNKQSVKLKASPSGKDVIQVVEYDEFGRQSIQHLPFTDVNNGAFHTDAITAQSDFFSTAAKVAHDTRPFSETEFESSPLNRVLSTTPQGQDWHDNNKQVTNNYSFNTEGEVDKWVIIAGTPEKTTTTSTYPANQLNVVEVTAEDGQVTKTYTNGLGQTILKRVKANETPIEWYDTYYVYDDFGNLRFVIPPKLSALTSSPTWKQLRALGFEYRYDGRRRMIKKFVPGAECVNMVYDQWDRLVMTQDGNQRDVSPKEWLYTKYDELNRPIMTGVVTDNRSLGNIQRELDNSEGRFENRIANEVGYSLNNSYPTNAQIADVLTVTFYDDYDFMDADWTDLAFVAESGFDATHNDQVKGQVTGSMTRAIGQEWIRTASYYDDKYRPVQSVSNNHLGGIDRSSNAYDFIGNVVKTFQNHTSSFEAVTVLKEFEYDHANRLLREYNTIDDEARILVAENHYNELGELVEKNIHAPHPTGQPEPVEGFLQSMDYRYNIRGWLTDINNHKLQNDGGITNDDTNDLFGMRLSYNQDQYTANGEVLEKQYGGNIAGVKWSSNNLVDTPTEQAYVYHYDKVNRLTKATYGAFNTDTNFTGQAFYSMNASYDENGNILTLNRKGKLSGNLIDMDLLAYQYEDGNKSNRLYRVEDGGNDAEGYKEIGGVPGELYYYDANGNMIADVNKEIVRIEYNHLNLPIEVEFLDGKLITYEYDAAGIKLRQTVDDGTNTPKVTDYLGLGVYEDQELSFLFTSEGRAIKYANSYGYEYFLKDHLGNTRVAFGDLPEREEYKATMEGERSGYEESYFEFPTNTRVNAENRTPLGNESVALNGVVTDRRVGPAKVLNITAGDKIELEVWAKYTFSSWNNTSVADIANAISGAFGGASTGTGGESASSSLNSALSTPGANGLFADADNGEPRAYLQYMFFNQAHSFRESHSGFIAVGTEAEGAFAKLDRVVEGFTEDGYLFVYIVNESNQDAEVYFDDLRIVQESAATSLVVNSSQDYYPFGLTFNESVRKVITPQNYKFGGKEGQKDWGVGVMDFQARMYDAALGRWYKVDPAAESYFSYSPYNYVRNNPINRIDPTGMWDIHVHVSRNRKKYGYGIAVVTDRNGKEVYRFAVRAEGTAGTDVYKKNSNTPTGVYDIPDDNMWIAGSDGAPGTSGGKKRAAYGPNHRLILNGLAGEIVDTGRDLIRVHGGRQEKYNSETGEWELISDAELKKTYGCLRSSDCDIKTLKEITDELMANDAEEKGGVLIIRNDLESFLASEQEEEEEEETNTFWNGFTNALSQGIDNLQSWLKDQGF
ncbi:RHS repeat-associated core domain-containing protein [Ekhidna lutea]|uniref:RHS repeat-associated core domain-containing protein n=1 Tax=Ekhidna lutea TaxID=447679 RepID=A0A239HBW4_EKHLU|nr:DUF6443 domain-containing protein [Ekhidna lutea]SNS77754.1 RHS repeat-associated core domain-containing protein [Ekhidna lutea]